MPRGRKFDSYIFQIVERPIESIGKHWRESLQDEFIKHILVSFPKSYETLVNIWFTKTSCRVWMIWYGLCFMMKLRKKCVGRMLIMNSLHSFKILPNQVNKVKRHW
jgi:hypothetical protein